MSWTALLDVLAGACLLAGAALTLAAGIGVLRFDDLLSRLHAAAKPQVLGVLLVLLAMGLRLRSAGATAVLVLVAAFQMLTAPVAAHMVGRAGYRTDKIDRHRLVVDELTTDLAAAEAGELPDEPAHEPADHPADRPSDGVADGRAGGGAA